MKDDKQFVEQKITKVEEAENGCAITFDDLGTLYVEDCPATPHVGDTARLYGRGMGYPVRGLYVNDIKFYYRTEEEDKEKQGVDLYGKDTTEWLRRWDNDQVVWSIEMGGMGPGYEQAIQVTVAEILRFMLEKNYSASDWEEEEWWKRDRKEIEAASFKNERISELGLSGAQYGAAVGLASKLYLFGPRGVMDDEQVKDRHIQVCRKFP